MMNSIKFSVDQLSDMLEGRLSQIARNQGEIYGCGCVPIDVEKMTDGEIQAFCTGLRSVARYMEERFITADQNLPAADPEAEISGAEGECLFRRRGDDSFASSSPSLAGAVLQIRRARVEIQRLLVQGDQSRDPFGYAAACSFAQTWYFNRLEKILTAFRQAGKEGAAKEQIVRGKEEFSALERLLRYVSDAHKRQLIRGIDDL